MVLPVHTYAIVIPIDILIQNCFCPRKVAVPASVGAALGFKSRALSHSFRKLLHWGSTKNVHVSIFFDCTYNFWNKMFTELSHFPWGSMVFFGVPFAEAWGPFGFLGVPWGFLGFLGVTWGSLGFHGVGRIGVALWGLEFLVEDWVPYGSLEFLGVPWVSFGFLVILWGFLGFLWDSLGFLLVPVDS